MNYYVLVYDRRQAKILKHREYSEDQRTQAFADRLSEMIARRNDDDTEVILFAADSYDDLVKTHSRYFRTPGKILADIEPLKL